jgi:hypothetical protein
VTNDITSYLLLPEQARWAKDRGFDGQCAHKNYNGRDLIRFCSKTSNSKCHGVKHLTFTVPTFEQFFDWVEENYNVVCEIHRQIKTGLGDFSYAYSVSKNVITRLPDNFIAAKGAFPDKRSARIAAVSEIIKHIDNLKK